jgi:synaptic vesicle membrane protein VAT-1
MASAERQVWRIRRAGSLGRLRLEREASPDPGPGEARVAVRAAGLNFADAFACLGLYSATPRGPFVPGLECAGVVDAVGPPREGEAPRFRPGDRVMAVTRFGGYATRVVVDTRQLHPLPERFGFAEGAAYPVQALTAWYGLVELGRIAPGEVVLVHSAAGGVGLAALEVCASRGSRVIATVGGAGKRDFLVRERGLAADAVIVRDRRRFGAQLDAAFEALGVPGLDLVLDAVMGPFFGPALERLRPEGRHVVFGAADFMAARDRPALGRLAVGWLRRPRVDPLALVSANRAVIGFNLIWLWDAIDRLPAAYAALERLVPRKPEIGARLPFARAPDALRLLQRGETVGKVVLEVE